MYGLVNLANIIMRNSFVLATTEKPDNWTDEQWEKFSWIYQITDDMDMILWPLLIIVASAGSIYAVVLGVNMARADSTEKREEAKKRLVNVLIGIGIIIGLILFLKLAVSVIFPALLGYGKTK